MVTFHHCCLLRGLFYSLNPHCTKWNERSDSVPVDKSKDAREVVPVYQAEASIYLVLLTECYG